MADDITLKTSPPALRPVGDLIFHIGDGQYTFTPSTARPQDMPYLLMLFTALLAQRATGPIDTWTFVNEHSLWHCFKER